MQISTLHENQRKLYHEGTSNLKILSFFARVLTVWHSRPGADENLYNIFIYNYHPYL
ncbi:MAG: hypothetical protein M3139_03220 [Bacteroidota bacterium]|nr:hypothetical protein [Bacteroidota bacterium]